MKLVKDDSGIYSTVCFRCDHSSFHKVAKKHHVEVFSYKTRLQTNLNAILFLVIWSRVGKYEDT